MFAWVLVFCFVWVFFLNENWKETDFLPWVLFPNVADWPREIELL